jgi:hypothetical protein
LKRAAGRSVHGALRKPVTIEANMAFDMCSQ